MTKRERIAAAAAAVLIIFITGFSAWSLIGEGTLSWHVRQPETVRLALELLVFWGIFLGIFCIRQSAPVKLAAILVVMLLYSWLHVIFFPVVLAGLYTGYLILAGRFFTGGVIGRKLGLSWEFLFGSSATILIFCLASLLRVGSIPMLRLWVCLSGAVLVFFYVRPRWPDWGLQERENLKSSAMKAAILALFLLQAGRMNHGVDFDSIWYGVRSHLMLNPGNGIYENLGTLGVVYTYSKGWETLTLPLSGLPSYSFPIAFNLAVAGILLKTAYDTARMFLRREAALWVPFLMAALPGIMNMAITAKADLLTVFCQILMVQGVLRYQKERDLSWLLFGLSAGGVSLALKPTSVVYSPAIVGIAVLWLMFRKTGEKSRLPVKRDFCSLVLAAAMLAGIWGRTLSLVGVPVTSVFYGAFQKIGFQIRYPFYASAFPSAGSSGSFGEILGFFGRRLYGVLINPQGEDMAHVIIAWGTVLPLVFLVLWLFFRKDKNSHRQAIGFLEMLLLAVTVINGVSLYSLSQLDGNYYMLAYTLVILTGVIWLDELSAQKQRVAKGLLIPVWLYAAILCAVTNWAWALGLSPMKLVNQGFYNHVQAERVSWESRGSGAIWNILAADPKTRVIALGEHPRVLTVPCEVQSYVDVSGYWGNPEVVADAPSFLNYLQFAGIDYLYMEREYIDTSVRIYQIVRTLVEEGWLLDVREEHGNLILSVGKDGADPGSAAGNLDVFDNGYIQHP